jgi:chromate reductase
VAVKVLAFAGSLRKGSFNRKLLAFAVPLVREAGAEVTVADLKELPMPVYDGDLEEASGVPENGRKLKALMKAADAFLIATPEYNSAIPGMLKNVIDWASRSEEGEKELECFRGKVCGLLSASPGALGGMRSLASTRSIFENIGTLVIPNQVAVGRAHEAFADDGSLKDQRLAAAVKAATSRLVEVAGKLKA